MCIYLNNFAKQRIVRNDNKYKYKNIGTDLQIKF